jgi:hypothetical protein
MSKNKTEAELIMDMGWRMVESTPDEKGMFQFCDKDEWCKACVEQMEKEKDKQ